MMKRMLTLIAICGIALIAIACQIGEDTIFLVPYGYQGDIVIFLERPYGEPPQYENGVRVFEIPQNGALFSQFGKTSRFADYQVFYVDANGKRTKIPYIDEIDMVDADTKAPIDSEQVYVYRTGYANIHLNEGETLKNVPGYKPGDTVKTSRIVLSSPRNWDSISALMLHQHEELYDLAPYKGE